MSGIADAADALADQAARDLIVSAGLDRTLFVEAGAGSGKTQQLVQRIVSLVTVRGVRLPAIAAITFTEAAAAELQTRIRSQFERLARTTDDDVVRERCRLAVAESDVASISTLHGFASRLLAEFAVEAGLPPQVTVLDEVSSQLAHERRWTRFVDALHADPAHEELVMLAQRLRIPLEADYLGQVTFRQVADRFTQHWDRLGPLVDAPVPELRAADLTPFARAVDHLRAVSDTCTDPTDKYYVQVVDRLVRAEATLAIDDPGRRLAALADTTWTAKRNCGKGGNWGGDIAAAHEAVASLESAAAAVVGSATDSVLRRLTALTAAEVWAAAHERRRAGGLEFHDLLVLARDLLRRSDRVRRVLHDRFEALLLDEFQDTDPLQIDLAAMIAASVEGPVSRRWDRLTTDPGRLFFVGDPKQSIYRFRRADIGLFMSARDHFGGDHVVRLTTNFRTVPAVLAWVNHVFRLLMPAEKPGTQPRFEPLAAHRTDLADHRPVLLGGPHPDPKVRAGELRELEAADVAATISAILERPDEWPVEPTGEARRHPRRSDIAVLIPTRMSLPFLRRALDDAAIPYRLATGTLVYDTQEVRDLLSALRAIADPTDLVSLVAALRSPLYACTDVELADYRNRTQAPFSLTEPSPESVPDDHPVRLALADLRRRWEERWWSTPADLLDALIRDRHAALAAFGDPRPTEVWRRLRFLVDQARAFESSTGGGIAEFLDWAELQGADGARAHEPLLDETDTDAVRIMTVHGAKGLEFPITILSGMSTLPGRSSSGFSVLWADEADLGHDGEASDEASDDEAGDEVDLAELPEVRLRSGVSTSGHEPRVDLEQDMDADEKVRLLYVATTRARDHLVVSCHHKPGRDGAATPASKKSYAQQVWDACAEHPELWRHADAVVHRTPAAVSPTTAPAATSLAPAPPADGPVPTDDRDAWRRRRAELVAAAGRGRVTSATAIAAAAHGPVADADGSGVPSDDVARDDGEVERELAATDGSALPLRPSRSGSAIGRAVHATLEVVEFASPVDAAVLRGLVRRHCEVEAIPDEVESVLRRVTEALTSDVVRRAAAHPHHKELFVATPVGDHVVEGYVDLLIEEPDGLVVVDYKTDRATSPAEIDAAVERYELQAATYAVALEATTGLRVAECRFLFCGERAAVERSVADLAGAMARVRAHLGAG